MDRVWLGCRHVKIECGERSRFAKFVVLGFPKALCRSQARVDVVPGMSCEVILAIDKLHYIAPIPTLTPPPWPPRTSLISSHPAMLGLWDVAAEGVAVDITTTKEKKSRKQQELGKIRSCRVPITTLTCPV